MFSISFCFQLLQRITWLSQYLHFSNYRDGCVDILYISTVSIIYTEHIYLSIYLSIYFIYAGLGVCRHRVCPVHGGLPLQLQHLPDRGGQVRAPGPTSAFTFKSLC